MSTLKRAFAFALVFAVGVAVGVGWLGNRGVGSGIDPPTESQSLHFSYPTADGGRRDLDLKVIDVNRFDINRDRTAPEGWYVSFIDKNAKRVDVRLRPIKGIELPPDAAPNH